MIGRRLKAARRAAGLTQRALSERMGGLVSDVAISKYEADRDMPSSKVLLALGKALNVTPDYLLSTAPVEVAEVDFRRLASTRKRELARLEAALIDHTERYLLVEEALGLPSAAWHVPDDEPPEIHSLDSLEDVADWLRRTWRLGCDPIPNLVELLEEQGAKVLALPLEGINGGMAMVRHEEAITPVIVINRQDSGERQRFTLAHELGHLLLANRIPDGMDEEKAAQRFASAFLMPAEAIRAELGSRRTSLSAGELFRLKLIFRTSVQAITYRARDLGIISAPGFTRLFRYFSKMGWRRGVPEPLPVLPEIPRRFERLVLRALSEDAMSPAKAAELLRIPVRDLRPLLEDPPPPAPLAAA
jgi:Zn-dependent peptidase ImmA (M78 family)/DNA-binding XRE family transcriptional regulator